MKLDRVIWGILLLFIGGVLLLDNFGVIEFYWRNVFNFWPVFLIILGINILFNKNNSQTGNIISLGILLITLSFLFVKGQNRPEHGLWWDKKNFHFDDNDDEKWNSDTAYSKLNYAEPFLAGDSEKKTTLNIRGGANTYELKGETDSLFTADVSESRKGMKYMLSKEAGDSTNTITFKTSGKSKGFSFESDGSAVRFYMNLVPTWDMNVFMGAGKVDLDLAKYKVRTFNFEGGAADVDVKFSDLLPITDVNMEVGLADITIEIPKGSGCRIKTKTGFSSKEFDGFNKLENGTYETPNYKTSVNKIFINLDGGLSDFKVKRY